MLLGGCATLGEPSGGDTGLPNALAGPFRELRAGEVGNDRVAPYVLRDPRTFVREVSIVDADGDPATLSVVGYAAEVTLEKGEEASSEAPTNALVRFSARDGRTFEREGTVVLAQPAGWEGATLASPSAVRTAGGDRLYYSAAGGIGLAESADGMGFVRIGSGPVLGVAAEGWDAGVVPRAPSVVQLPGGAWRMFYEAAGAIGEAESADGVTWVRRAASVLEAGPAAVAVRAPCAVLSTSPGGRTVLWLYHASENSEGHRVIDVAARDGIDGPFIRASAPVFAMDEGIDPTEPSVVRFATFSLLFVTARAGTTASLAFPAVVGAAAPATVALPPPDPR